jgi:MOSC domain-containing protein YiiM
MNVLSSPPLMIPRTSPCVGEPARHESRIGRLVAVCTSAGGIPKRPLAEVSVNVTGLVGDAHAHAKHNRADRAVSLFDLEVLRQLVAEGFPLEPGTAGENLTVAGLNVQSLPPGTILEIGDVVLRLEAPRKPCYVLDAIDPRLKETIVGRCGYMASVLRGGTLRAGMVVGCRRAFA